MKEDVREDFRAILKNGEEDTQVLALVAIALELDRIATSLNDIYVSMPS